MKRRVFIALAAGAALLTLGACGNSQAGSEAATTALSGKTGKIIAGGSTALQPLVQQASTEFMAKHPNVQITVQGGGSGVGLTQVSTAAFQIGDSDIFAEEKSGIESSKLTDHKVAVVGFAPIVNRASTGVSNLTSQQLSDIFTGKVTNWRQVGGKNQKITVISRTAGSGTRVNFDKFALGGATEINGPTQDASGSVVTMVGQTPGAISYAAFSYLKNSSAIKALALNGVQATDANVENNTWKIWSYEHMYTNAGKASAADKAFIDYVAADKQDLTKLGYIPVSEMKVSRSAIGTISHS